MNEQDFLEVIRNNPTDPVPRLVYADWLDERGDSRGEFIRVQCELSGGDLLLDRQALFEQYQRELLDVHEAAWSARHLGVSEEALGKARLEFCLGLPFFPVIVDYAKSLEEMLGAGQYDEWEGEITAEYFPVTGNGQVGTEVILVYFDRDIESEDAICEMEQRGLEPARIEHLLALGARYQDLQREFLIVCLGSSLMLPCLSLDPSHRQIVPCLDRWRWRRDLTLNWFDSVWSRGCRFGAVRK